MNNNSEIANLANDFLDDNNDGRFVYKYISEHKSDSSEDDWVVRFRVESIDAAMFDSPVLIVVNTKSKKARFYGDR
jgi:3-methyladenine DNA glycosylase AlkC